MRINWIDWVLIIAILILGSLYAWYALFPKTPNPEVVYIEPLPYNTENSTYSTFTTEKPIMPELQSVAVKDHTQDWMDPPIVEIGKFFPGAVAEHFVLIGNASDKIKYYKVYARKPDNYRSPENQYMPLEWIKILADNGKVMVKPKSATQVPVIIAVPPGTVNGKNFETWIVSQDYGIFTGETPGGMLGTFNGSRWLLHFK